MRCCGSQTDLVGIAIYEYFHAIDSLKGSQKALMMAGDDELLTWSTSLAVRCVTAFLSFAHRWTSVSYGCGD